MTFLRSFFLGKGEPFHAVAIDLINFHFEVISCYLNVCIEGFFRLGELHVDLRYHVLAVADVALVLLYSFLVLLESLQVPYDLELVLVHGLLVYSLRSGEIILPLLKTF